MNCSNCNISLVHFAVPSELRAYCPDGDEEALAICPRCLSLQPTDIPISSPPAFERISASFPDGEAAIPMALVLGLLDSLALNRSEIEQLVEQVEREGADPLLLLDRLDHQGSVDPRWKIHRRRHQLEQLVSV